MANKKISELIDATIPLSGGELVELVQDGVNKKTTLSSISAGLWQGSWAFPSGAYPTATAAGQQWYSDDDHDDEDGQLIAKDTLLISRAVGTGSANFIKKM